MSRETIGRCGYVLLTTGVLAVSALVLWSSLTRARLWEDEAFNLTVPVNLLAGLGYTSDGTLSGSLLTPFDPRISTGPVVLLPIAAILSTGIDPVIGGRLVPAAFYVGLLAALWQLGRRVGGRWGAIAALASPLAFDTSALPSPIQGPTDILGEIPAAALLAWGLVALRQRPWLAGLLVGFAIQAKYISLLAIPGFALALLLAPRTSSWPARLRSLGIAALWVAAPTIVVEVVTATSLGFRGYLDHLRATWHFLRTGGQYNVDTSFAEKIATLASSWYLPPMTVAVIVLTLVVLGIWAAGIAARHPTVLARIATTESAPRRDDVRQILIVSAGGMLVFTGWWAMALHTPPWIRHPAPGIVAFVPVLVAFSVLAARILRSFAHLARRGWVWRIGSALNVLVLALALVLTNLAAVESAWVRPASELAKQREDALAVGDIHEHWIATEWGPLIGVVVLAGAHVAQTDAPPENIIGYPRLLNADDSEVCDDSLVTTPRVALCAAPR